MNFIKLYLLLKCSKEYSHNQKIKSGLNDTESLICLCVYTNPAYTQDDIAKTLKMDKTTLSKALPSLEKKGYIMRTVDDVDHRKKHLTLTEAGQKKCVEISSMHKKWFNDIIKVLSDEEQIQFENCCNKLLNVSIEKLKKMMGESNGKDNK